MKNHSYILPFVLLIASSMTFDGLAYFDYLRGRVMKVEVGPGVKVLSAALYDRDNGHGAAATVVDSLRQ